jgi:hypothetical protein
MSMLKEIGGFSLANLFGILVFVIMVITSPKKIYGYIFAKKKIPGCTEIV